MFFYQQKTTKTQKCLVRITDSLQKRERSVDLRSKEKKNTLYLNGCQERNE